MNDRDNPYAPPQVPAEPARNAFGTNKRLALVLLIAAVAIIVLLGILSLFA